MFASNSRGACSGMCCGRWQVSDAILPPIVFNVMQLANSHARMYEALRDLKVSLIWKPMRSL